MEHYQEMEPLPTPPAKAKTNSMYEKEDTIVIHEGPTKQMKRNKTNVRGKRGKNQK